MADDQVKLLGSWVSPYSCRVVWALKLKGIPYEFIQEDTVNKSDLLLRYNPVHKKIPVLVHTGKPICESMVIVEYIEATWPNGYPLLPSDPYDTALAKFWIKFADDKFPSFWTVYKSKGEEQEKAIKESHEILETIENHCLGGNKKFFGGDKLNMVDIAFGAIAHWLGIVEEVTGVKLVEAEKLPRIHTWIKNFSSVSAVKESLPDKSRLCEHMKRRREMWLAS